MPDLFETRLSRRWRALLVAGTLAAVAAMMLAVPQTTPLGRLALIALATAQVAVVWWMDRRPLWVAMASLVIGAALELLHVPSGPGVSLFVLTTLAWLSPARTSLWGLAAAVGLFTAALGATDRWPQALLWSGAALLAWSWGALGRARSARRESEARRMVLQERARITRELHDVLAHTVSLMVLQAAAANDVFDSHPEQARSAVEAVETVGRQALDEIRRLLGAIDGDRHHAAPAPDLADLDRLAESISKAGVEVTVHRHGDIDVAPVVAEAAYRIAQESLTNVVRHAGAGRATIDLRITKGELTLTITDPGGGGVRHDHGSGRGLDGMRERATRLGGRLDAGPTREGGFRVEARLPVNGHR
ncbi:signal transduction histidine kinase [Nocardia tenerifensis]|uniref:histidine kinase n=1 Tax=Nocardia tenerifensis TaxID=228006 RepID=A0A318KJG1_9NOCA|nr:histidine kinase [Nocardia tenerifensis]PXX61097.1 signal transduction histidine kinase [Nocardia tenerifensis]